VLAPGDSLTIIDLPEYGRIAVAICYDIRFPELAMVAARRGCFALIYPGAFNTTTGPLHWRLQGQARAMDNQLYVALCSPARDDEASYRAWGHSLVCDPMAEVLVEAGEREEIVYSELDGEKIESTRKNIPVYSQRRFDVYPDVSEGTKTEVKS
jgi:omega-amidase